MGAVPAEAQTGPQKSSLSCCTSPPRTGNAPRAEALRGSALPGPVSETIGQEIVLTGSFIQGSAESAALPIDVVDVEELADRGTPSILDLLKVMPSSSGVVGDTNQFDARSSGSDGSGSFNLLPLTLVLLNDRRLAYNAVPSTSGAVGDTKLISSAAISRVEVLNDGASALYGSDAIAGVVNFMTRTDQRGLALAGDLRVIDGPDGDWLLSSSYGNQLGKLNVFLSGGYRRHRSPLQAIKRDCTWVTFLEKPNGGYTLIINPGTYAPLGANFSAIGAPRREVIAPHSTGFPGFTGKTPACYSQTSWPVLPNLA